ncbi:unnamed protein product [Pseudo-nitzschia multistriata]|uniref:Uncharacterized protein n=1 Tax=Pseudo-nitzschia multistriata TaxID=183589 RepID=A0A448ZFW5_9STRA|nr:unnamed protein product [Pseudo-nitzschia multistriata]
MPLSAVKHLTSKKMIFKESFFLLLLAIPCESFVCQPKILRNPSNSIALKSFKENNDWTSDFDGFVGDGGDNIETDSDNFSDFLTAGNGNSNLDITGVQTRLFSLGEDLIINDFVGNMGFEEVTDWEYYYESEDDPTDRKVVSPNPFDASKPKRTRTSSGSVVRVFRGELIGRLGASIRSRGLDQRILIKEYSGKFALELAKRDQQTVGKLQSKLMENKKDASDGGWIQSASSRSVLGRTDDKHVGDLLQELRTAPYLGILGEVNLAELEDEMDPNEFYRALGVSAPKPGAVWIVFEYGKSTATELHLHRLKRNWFLPALLI